MAEKYFRRGHWVRKSAPKNKKASGWVILAVIVGAAWFWGTLPDEGHDVPQRPSPVSEPVAPVPDPIAEHAGADIPPPEPTEAP
ncbi:hypothetical protein ACLQ2R_33575 [Streptosporangium sp. DT93]|uniref:hypothetical protein n=1 Tax=Streptosporangium sp. DT93 TaxID=3393428 RepID=UPI003CEEAE50